MKGSVIRKAAAKGSLCSIFQVVNRLFSNVCVGYALLYVEQENHAMSTRKNGGCAYAVLGGVSIIFTITLFFVIGFFVQAASLLWSGLPAQGTIVGTHSVTCGGKPSHPGFNYTVQFTDRVGQTHLATLHGCDITLPGTSSFPIVYLTNDPETIDLPGAAPLRFWLSLGLVLFIALLDLPFTGLLIKAWITQRRNERRPASTSPV